MTELFAVSSPPVHFKERFRVSLISATQGQLPEAFVPFLAIVQKGRFALAIGLQ